jgi:hypothetical protein
MDVRSEIEPIYEVRFVLRGEAESVTKQHMAVLRQAMAEGIV